MRLVLKIYLPLLFACLAVSKPSGAQFLSSKLNIGLDLFRLTSGTPQVLLDYHPHPILGVSAATGYSFRPVRGGVKIDDDVTLLSSKGAYFKLGLRVQAPGKDFRKGPVGFLQLWYVHSGYNERAERPYFDSVVQQVTRQARLANGSVDGWAATLGADFRFGKSLAVRAGVQIGHYNRDDHVGSRALTVQPGFGAPAMFGEVSQQLVLGLIYRTGRIGRGSSEPMPE